MRLSFVGLLLVAASFVCYAQEASPRITAVDPPNGKKGDVITVTGENLQKEVVAKMFLTDGVEPKNDIALELSSQSATEIKFKIPVKAAGRMALMIQTATKPVQLIEQPWKITVDDGTPPGR